MTEQLALFLDPSIAIEHEPLRAHLHRVWPIIEPWGDMTGHAIRHVIREYPAHDRFVLLLESSTHHRWHLGWQDDHFDSSGAGWRDGDGKSYLLKKRRAA